MTAKPANAERQAKGKAEVAHEPARDAGPGAGSSVALADALPGWTPADPIHHLGPPQVAALQRSAGNHAVADLLRLQDPGVQRTPASAPPKPGTGPAAKLAPFNSYADLLNGFQDLATALINRGGAGLDTVHFGPDLTPAHRSLLWTIRTALIEAQDTDPANRHKAAGTWRAVSGRLLTAVGEAGKLGAPTDAIASVNDQIAMINKRLGSARGRKDVPEAESGEDYVDTIKAIDQLFIESMGLLEGGPSIIREEAPGRPDIEVNSAVVELNAERRALISGVKLGSHATSRHAQLVERLRSTLILMRSEKAGSAYAASARWRSIEGELRYVLQRGAHYVDGDLSEAVGRLEHTKEMIDAHYAAVHTGNLEAVLSKKRDKGELKERREFAEKWGPGMQAVVAEKIAVEDVGNAFDIIQNHLVKSDREGEWNISNGGTSMRIREDQAANLHALAQQQLKSYIASLVTALVAAREDYDSIKLGNSRTKLRVLGFLGGADDPGSFEKETADLIVMRDQTVKPMIERGDYVGAFKLIMDLKPQIEKRVKAEADYDADLDSGYRRLAVTMSIVQVALVSLVPIAGEAALATAPMWAVGLTATAAGGGGAFIGEGTRQLVTGDHDASRLGKTTLSGVAIGTTAFTGPAAKQFGTFMTGGSGGFAATGFEAAASGTFGGVQSVAQGGTFGEGFAGNFLGTMGSKFTGLLPGSLQTGVPGKIVQVGVGAGIGELTTGDPLGGAVGALVPSVVSKGPHPAGGHEEAAPATGGAPTEATAGRAPATAGGAPATTDSSLPLPGLGGGVPEGPAVGATTVPGTFAPLESAAPAGPAVGAETTPGTFPPRPPAPPTAPAVAAETIPGSGIQERPPSTPAGAGTAPDGLAGRPVPAGGATTAADGLANRAAAAPADGAIPVGAATGDAGANSVVPGAPADKRVPVSAATGDAGAGSVVPGAPADRAAAPQPTGVDPALDATGRPAPTPGEAATGQPGQVGGPQPGNQPVIRPPAAAQQPRSKGRPLLPNAQVPADLPQSSDPAYRYDKLVAGGQQIRHDITGRPDFDAKADLAAGGAVPTSGPTATYAKEEAGRFQRTGEKPAAGLSKDEAYVVKDTLDGDRKYLFKPVEAEYAIPRAEARGIDEQAPREVAGPMVAEQLGIDAPRGKLVTIGDKQGVLIEWREQNSLSDLALQDPEGFKRLIESEAFREALQTTDALDYLINNLDRATNFGNYLYEFTPDGKLKLTPIDHALTFTSTRERASIDAYTRELPERYPPDLVQRLEQLSKNRAEFIEKIRPFVGDAAVEGFSHRLDIMIEDMHVKQRTGRS